MNVVISKEIAAIVSDAAMDRESEVEFVAFKLFVENLKSDEKNLLKVIDACNETVKLALQAAAITSAVAEADPEEGTKRKGMYWSRVKMFIDIAERYQENVKTCEDKIYDIKKANTDEILSELDSSIKKSSKKKGVRNER